MPQPVHHSQPIHFDFSPGALALRPALAVHICTISAYWNEIEARIGAFLAALVGADAALVISVYVAIKNDGAKRVTIDTISAAQLSPDDHQKFQQILRATNTRYADRNMVVHGSWGISSVYPNKLLWKDIRETTIFHLEMMKLRDASHQRGARALEEQKRIVVYDEKDFLDIERRMLETLEELRDFTRPFMEQRFGRHARVDPPANLPRRGTKEPLDPSDF